MSATTHQVNLRLSPEHLALLDAEVARLAAERPGETVNRADVLRGLIARLEPAPRRGKPLKRGETLAEAV